MGHDISNDAIVKKVINPDMRVWLVVIVLPIPLRHVFLHLLQRKKGFNVEAYAILGL
jgi:hypothetical protein